MRPSVGSILQFTPMPGRVHFRDELHDDELRMLGFAVVVVWSVGESAQPETFGELFPDTETDLSPVVVYDGDVTTMWGLTQRAGGESELAHVTWWIEYGDAVVTS